MINDREFFTQHLDLSVKDLMPVGELAKKGEFAQCRKLFASYVRSALRPELYLPCTECGSEVGMDEELFETAERACRNCMESCGTPYDFGEKVDWTFNPTYNQYREWPWQLNRHLEWRALSRAFRATKDKKYADAFKTQLSGWIEQATAPKSPCPGGDTVCWRTIECGIRQGQVWPEVIHSFYMEMSDDLLTDWCKSVWEHGNRLFWDHVSGGNWLIMEMNGLAHIGVLYPWLKEAKEWLSLAEQLLYENLKLQIYPDGFQYELATGYQFVVIRNYIVPMKLFRAYGRKIPAQMYETVRNMLLCYLRIMRPDRRVPAVNDGYFDEVPYVVDFCREFYGQEDVFSWILGEGGSEPAERSWVFEYAGLAALRTDWGEKDSYVFFDGGPFGAGHQHEDKLSVLFYADGKALLTEGNKFAYDGSEMEKYVRSTRAHNTVRVDFMDQNRKRTFRAGDIDLNEKSGLHFRLSDGLDALCGVYEEEYGEEGCVGIRHERSLYFIKDRMPLRPFLVVCDRMYAAQEHHYEVMWHLDAEQLLVKDGKIKADTLHVTVARPDGKAPDFCISYGCTWPEYQGWTSDSDVQDDYRPIYNVSYFVHGKNVRWVTVLYPDGGKELSVNGVNAGMNPEDTKIEILLSDGKCFGLDELEMWGKSETG